MRTKFSVECAECGHTEVLYCSNHRGVDYFATELSGIVHQRCKNCGDYIIGQWNLKKVEDE